MLPLPTLNSSQKYCREPLGAATGLVARGTHWLVLSPREGAARTRRTLQQQLNDPPVLAFSAIPQQVGYAGWQNEAMPLPRPPVMNNQQLTLLPRPGPAALFCCGGIPFAQQAALPTEVVLPTAAAGAGVSKVHDALRTLAPNSPAGRQQLGRRVTAAAAAWWACAAPSASARGTSCTGAARCRGPKRAAVSARLCWRALGSWGQSRGGAGGGGACQAGGNNCSHSHTWVTLGVQLAHGSGAATDGNWHALLMRAASEQAVEQSRAHASTGAKGAASLAKPAVVRCQQPRPGGTPVCLVTS